MNLFPFTNIEFCLIKGSAEVWESGLRQTTKYEVSVKKILWVNLFHDNLFVIWFLLLFRHYCSTLFKFNKEDKKF